jgi:hypothetical protein
MTTTRLNPHAFACLAAAGCGGGLFAAGTSPPRGATTTSTRRYAPAPVNDGYASFSSPPAPTEAEEAPRGASKSPAPAAAGAEAYGYPATTPDVVRPEPTPESRPGLGTTFGETRSSRVRDVAFERAADRPQALATLYYNDRPGVDAMVAYDRRSARLDAPVPIRGGLTASVVDEAGRPLEAMSVGGRIYVIGEVGGRYALQVHNLTNRRYELVASVDGLDVVDGRPASVEKRGYLIDPYGTITIDGFRRNHDEVAAFRFGAVSESYAAKTSGDRNVGVIGLAFFDEVGAEPWTDGEIEKRRTAQPFSDARFAQPPPF